MHIHRDIILYMYVFTYMHKYRMCKYCLKIEEKISSKSGENKFKVKLGTKILNARNIYVICLLLT